MSRAENPPVAFICELKKQVRVGLVPRGEGQSAIPGRADVAHRISHLNDTGTMIWFRSGLPYRASLDRGEAATTHGRALLRRMQIALEPAAKGLGMQRIFVRAKRCKYLTADSALKRMQVHAWAF